MDTMTARLIEVLNDYIRSQWEEEDAAARCAVDLLLLQGDYERAEFVALRSHAHHWNALEALHTANEVAGNASG